MAEAMKADGRLISARAAAEYLGIPYTTLRDWAARGVLRVVRVPDCRRWWFDPADLDAAIERWKVPGVCSGARGAEPMLPFDDAPAGPSAERRSS